MPGPSSVTVSTASRRLALTPRAVVTVVPSSVCLRALDSRFISTWRSCRGSPRTTTGSSGSSRAQRCEGAATCRSETLSTTSSVRSTSSLTGW